MWVFAIFIFLSHKRGVSSCQLARDIGVTQKTAWVMLQKIREFMGALNANVVKDEVEIDETFVGGKNKNRHKDKKVEKSQGRSFKDKTPVFGMLQRDGKLTALVVNNTRASTLKPIITRYIEGNSTIFTDGWDYGDIAEQYNQQSVDHSKHFYGTTRTNSDGKVTMICTNAIENAWSHFKRMIFGTYYQVSKKHLQRYVDEFVFRFNTRGIGEFERFKLYLQCIA